MATLRFAILVSVALGIAAVGERGAAYAQSPQPEAVQPKTFIPSPQQRKAYRKALRATFANPSDPETLARFADAAIRFGDMEGAISAMERLLLINGGQPELKLELGVLHYRMGSRQAAVHYLAAAQSAPDASPYVQERADVFLKAARR